MTKFLEEFSAFEKNNNLKLTRISEYKDGKIETVEFEKTNYCQNVYSVAKAFTMTAIGLLCDKGLLDVKDKACEILSDELPESGMDERWREATVENALTHRLGLPPGFLDIDVNRSTLFTENYLDYMFRYPLNCMPGEIRSYTDGAFYLLSCIVEKISGLPLDSFIWKELLVKLDYQEMAWSHCPMGHAMGGTGLYIHSSDMVKLGALYLNKGTYNGKRLLSEKWCETAVEKNYALVHNDEKTAYFKSGMHGQCLLVIPDSGRAVAIQSYCGNRDKAIEFATNYVD